MRQQYYAGFRRNLSETTSHTKPIFGFNNAVLKTLSGLSFSRAVAMSKKVVFSDYC